MIKIATLSFIMLMGGCNALFAADRNPSKLAVGLNKTIQVFMIENKAGIIKLKCDEKDVKIKITDNLGKLVYEKDFSNQPLEIDVREWEEGSYQYEIWNKDELVKKGSLMVNN